MGEFLKKTSLLNTSVDIDLAPGLMHESFDPEQASLNTYTNAKLLAFPENNGEVKNRLVGMDTAATIAALSTLPTHMELPYYDQITDTSLSIYTDTYMGKKNASNGYDIVDDGAAAAYQTSGKVKPTYAAKSFLEMWNVYNNMIEHGPFYLSEGDLQILSSAYSDGEELTRDKAKGRTIGALRAVEEELIQDSSVSKTIKTYLPIKDFGGMDDDALKAVDVTGVTLPTIDNTTAAYDTDLDSVAYIKASLDAIDAQILAETEEANKAVLRLLKDMVEKTNKDDSNPTTVIEIATNNDTKLKKMKAIYNQFANKVRSFDEAAAINIPAIRAAVQKYQDTKVALFLPGKKLAKTVNDVVTGTDKIELITQGEGDNPLYMVDWNGVKNSTPFGITSFTYAGATDDQKARARAALAIIDSSRLFNDAFYDALGTNAKTLNIPNGKTIKVFSDAIYAAPHTLSLPTALQSASGWSGSNNNINGVAATTITMNNFLEEFGLLINTTNGWGNWKSSPLQYCMDQLRYGYHTASNIFHALKDNHPTLKDLPANNYMDLWGYTENTDFDAGTDSQKLRMFLANKAYQNEDFVPFAYMPVILRGAVPSKLQTLYGSSSARTSLANFRDNTLTDSVKLTGVDVHNKSEVSLISPLILQHLLGIDDNLEVVFRYLILTGQL